jgi:hypothetical protein
VAVLYASFGACSDTATAPEPVANSVPETAAGANPAVAEGAKVADKRASGTPAKATPRSPKAKTPEVPFEGRRIALVHTANVVGELEPCG